MLKDNIKTIFILIIVLGIIFYSFLLDGDLNQESNDFELSSSELNVSKEKSQEKERKIIVHLSGAVKEAGVYQLNEDERLVDLIKAAGGLSEKADLEKINLAENLADGQKIVIPILNNNSKTAMANNTNNQAANYLNSNKYSFSANNSNLTNINQADQSELEKLSGIGPAKAAAIIKYREEHGLFRNKSDITKVSGIGEKTLANIKAEISL